MKWLSDVLPVFAKAHINKNHHESAHMQENLKKVEKSQWEQMAFLVLSGECGGKAGTFEPWFNTTIGHAGVFDHWFELCDACCIDMTNDLNINFCFGSALPNTTFELDENDGDTEVLSHLVKTAMNRAKSYSFKHHVNLLKANDNLARVVREVTMKITDGIENVMIKVVDALDSGDIGKLILPHPGFRLVSSSET